MTTPADSGAGVPSDKLVAPMNAPRGGVTTPGIQPGVSNQVVLAQYVIIFGTTGGIFIYAGTPGPGNPPIYSFSNADVDPYGNEVFPGIWAGVFGGNQVGMQTASGSSSIIFPTQVVLNADPSLLTIQALGGVEFNMVSGKDTANPAATSDRAILAMYDNAAGNGSARWQLGYFDATGGFQQHAFGDFTGMSINAAKSIRGLKPGTGTSTANPFKADTFNTAALINSWAASSGVAGLYYQITPDGNSVEIIADIIHATATGNSVCAVLPTGYIPSVSQNHPASWNNPAASNSASVPWVSVQTNGNIQVTGIESANHEIFFHIFVPLGAL